MFDQHFTIIRDMTIRYISTFGGLPIACTYEIPSCHTKGCDSLSVDTSKPSLVKMPKFVTEPNQIVVNRRIQCHSSRGP